MLKTKYAGQGSTAQKYDLITALGSHALSLNKTEQRRVLRLITLVTARYNWGRNELAVGQREIARLWSCDERTVKREMARFRALGWLTVKRQGARGRVTEYQMELADVMNDTRATWEAVGPDFALRVEGAPEQTSVVPFPAGTQSVQSPPPDISDGTEWSLAQAVLHQEDQARFGAWLQALTRGERAGGRLTLRAPSRFHARYVQNNMAREVLLACQAVDSSVSEVLITD